MHHYPSPLTETQRQELIALLAHGVERSAAIDYVSADYRDFLRATQQDRGFADQLNRAERQFELAQLIRLSALAEKHWHAAAWMLERRFPERYARCTRGISPQAIREVGHKLTNIVLGVLSDPRQRDEAELQLRTYVEQVSLPEEADVSA